MHRTGARGLHRHDAPHDLVQAGNGCHVRRALAVPARCDAFEGMGVPHAHRVCGCNNAGRRIDPLAEASFVPTALVLNPRSDAAFVAFAEAALASGVTTPEAFQERLRERYPLAVVRKRELASEPFTIWYCYRDGRWMRP
jgi:hypothetical protein